MAIVVVYTRSPELSTALARFVSVFAEVVVANGLDAVPGSEPGSVIVSTVGDCPREVCSELAARGYRVVLLAPVPRESERQEYVAAGAAGYLPMTIDPAKLRAVVDSTS